MKADPLDLDGLYALRSALEAERQEVQRQITDTENRIRGMVADELLAEYRAQGVVVGSLVHVFHPSQNVPFGPFFFAGVRITVQPDRTFRARPVFNARRRDGTESKRAPAEWKLPFTDRPRMEKADAPATD